MGEPLPAHIPAPSAVGDLAGQRIVLAYSSAAAEYDALRTGALVVDRSHRGRFRFGGKQASEVLTGLVTNDVTALTPGLGAYAAALTPKGRIIADVRVFAGETDLLVDVPARAIPGWTAMLRKYVNPRFATWADETQESRALGVFGPAARSIVAAMTGGSTAALGAMAPYSHLTATVDGEPVVAARSVELAAEGYELFASPAAYEKLWERALAAGAVPGGLEAWEIARVEAGRPEWGLDMDDTTLPQEANLDELHAISYTKGCYTGQEIVARIHFRGHVNRHLCGVRSADIVPPIPGTSLLGANGQEAGIVRSAVASPRLGGIALAMIRREVEPGTVLVTHSETGERRVEVTPLPFAA